MSTRTTKSIFWRTVSEEVPKFFAPLGFVEQERGAFLRLRGPVTHGLGLTPNPSFTHVHVPVGATVPAIDSRTDYLNAAHYRTLLVSRWLGQFKPRFRQRDIYYHFATVEDLRAAFPRIYADFVEQAEPWLATLTTIEDVAREFYKWRIGPPSTGEVRPPDPFAWALYGWLLQEAGHSDDARTWLERAREFLQTPIHMKGGRIVPSGTLGSRAVPRRPEEGRLADLLERDLQLK